MTRLQLLLLLLLLLVIIASCKQHAADEGVSSSEIDGGGPADDDDLVCDIDFDPSLGSCWRSGRCMNCCKSHGYVHGRCSLKHGDACYCCHTPDQKRFIWNSIAEEFQYFLNDPVKYDVKYQASAQPFFVFGLLVTALATGH